MFENNKVVRAHNKYSKQLSFPVRILKRTPKQFIFTDFISGEYKARLVNDKWMYKETELFDDMDTFDFKKEIELELLEKTRNEKINKLMQKNTPFFAINIKKLITTKDIIDLGYEHVATATNGGSKMFRINERCSSIQM